MNYRRDFLKMASVAAVPAAALLSDTVARADDGPRGLTGTWSSVHTLPFPPGSFREFLSFSDGGVMRETNSFLHTASNLDFSMFGLPNSVNASDGMGVWEKMGRGVFQVTFRKLLFNGQRQNFGDLHVTGTIRIDGGALMGDWHIEVVDLLGKVLVDFGPATSQGVRIS